MKKYIFMTLALLCGMYAMAQQTKQRTNKIMVVHKSDGTKVEQILYFLPEGVHTWGQHTVKDNDYVKIKEISGTNDFNRIYIDMPEDVLERATDYGVLWSMNKDVNVDNGNKAEMLMEEWASDDSFYSQYYMLPYDSTFVNNTPYYFRAYVSVLGKTYYSEVQEYIFRPELSQYAVLPYNVEMFKEYGYVVPTDTAFKQMFVKQTGVECSYQSLSALKKEWASYVAYSYANSIDKNAAERIICYECDLYMINYVPEEFVKQYFVEDTFYISGDNLNTDEELGLTTGLVLPVTRVECEESYGVYNKEYWKYTPVSATVNPAVAINMPMAIPGYTYNVSVVFAPETTNDTISDLPHKVRLTMYETDESGEFSRRGTTIKNPETDNQDFITDNVTKCDTISFEWEATNIAKCLLQLKTNLRMLEIKKGQYTREMRVVGVFVERKKK